MLNVEMVQPAVLGVTDGGAGVHHARGVGGAAAA